MSGSSITITGMGIICALGDKPREILDGLLTGNQDGMRESTGLVRDRTTFVGQVTVPLPDVPERLSDYRCRNNRFIVAAYNQISDDIELAKSRYGSDRVGIVIGTSTSGIAEGEKAVTHRLHCDTLPQGYNYKQQEMGTAAEFLAYLAGLSGIAYTVSTACASSSKVFASAKRLIEAGIIDACVVGGSDSLCGLTLNGFDALESVSENICNPFSQNRDGISIGEGAALFLLQKGAGEILLLGTGESSDAYHMSAPHPDGKGAETAIRGALADAGLRPEDIGYVNLHGTGTRKNDLMESKAINRIFGQSVPCSSTKSLVGHTLGAAGAIEIGFCWLTLFSWNRQQLLPLHRWDGIRDKELSPITLIGERTRLERSIVMSNSFAFGGSNASVIIGSKA
ncbi:MAG TPA: beta-ketoacyl-[acyl-carrier-protein] synthase family protein [Gammaproteobacteria bacterium]|nr:beta-ketoacyl-[acyl-carrier-protein] synthase family protein [Gammaproteobacteria bacterium]